MKVRELYEAINTGFWLRRDDDGEWLRPATKAEVKAFQKAVKKDMNATITVNGEEVHISKKSGLLARLQKAAVKEGEEVRVKDLLAEGAVSKKSKAVERLLKKKGFPAKVDVKGGLLTVKSSQAGAEQAVLLLKQMGLKAFVSKLIGDHGGGLTHQATLSLSANEDVQPIAPEILESLKMDWPAAASSVASTQLDKLYDDLNAFKKRHGRKVPSTTRRNIERALDSLVSLNAQLKRAEEGLYQ